MLEEVARARRAAALVEQLVDHQLTETALQHFFLDPGQGTDHVIGKLAPQHGAQLCHFTQPRRPIEPRHQRILQCLRDVQLRQRAREHVGLAAGLEHPRAENRLGQLLDVERHAVGFGDDMIDHLAGQRPAAGEMTDHRLDLRPLQAVERDRRHVRALRPGRRQFRPIGRDDQHRRGRRLLDQHPQCFQCRRISPARIPRMRLRFWVHLGPFRYKIQHLVGDQPGRRWGTRRVKRITVL